MAYKDPDVQKAYAKAHYQANRQKYLEAHRRNAPLYRERNKRRVLEYLQAHPCTDCGNDDPIVLQFDHVTGVKIDNIGTMLQRGGGWNKIATEMGKCEVVCANCHLHRTALRAGNWLKAQITRM